MAAEKSLLMNVSKAEMDTINQILQSRRSSDSDRTPRRVLCLPRPLTAAPLRINVLMNPSLDTIGAHCELKTDHDSSHSSTESADSDDGSSYDKCPYDNLSLSDLVFVEHSYAFMHLDIGDNHTRKKKITASKEKVSPNTVKNRSGSSEASSIRRSKRQIQKLEPIQLKEVTSDDEQNSHTQDPALKISVKNSTENKHLDEQLSENNVSTDPNDLQTSSYCSSYKSFSDFKKRHLKTGTDDEKNKELHGVPDSVCKAMEISSSDSLCNDEKEEINPEENVFEKSEPDVKLKSPIKRILKSDDTESADKMDVEESYIERNVTIDTDFTLLKTKDCENETVSKGLRKSVKTKKAIVKFDESEYEEANSISKQQLSSAKDASLDNRSLGVQSRRKKTVSFSEDLMSVDAAEVTPKKQRLSVDSKDIFSKNSSVTLSSTKFQKKKPIKKEGLRLGTNNNEPPLFSSPDVMKKVSSDDGTVKKEEKENDPSDIQTNLQGDVLKTDEGHSYDDVPLSEECNLTSKTIVKSDCSVEQNFQSKESSSTSGDSGSTTETASETVEQYAVLSESNNRKQLHVPSGTISEIYRKMSMNEKLYSGNILQQKNKEILNSESVNKTVSVNDDTKQIPERKSNRVIKKKEFFGDTSDSSDNKKTPINKKTNIEKNVPKRKVGRKSKTVRRERSRMSSQSEQEVDSDTSEDDDPQKLWCICRKPHNSRFMIQCDVCEDWFHGSCVGVTKQYGRLLEKQKKDWICPKCRLQGEMAEKGIANKISDGKVDDKGQRNLDKIHDSDEKISIQNIKAISKEYLMAQRSLSKPEVDKTVKSKSNKMSSDHSNAKSSGHAANKVGNDQTRSHLKVPVMPKSGDHRKAYASHKQSAALSENTLHIKKGTIAEAVGRITARANIKKKLSNSPKEKLTILKKKQNCVQCPADAKPNSCYCSDKCIEKYANQCLKNMKDAKGAPKGADFDSQRLVVIDRLKGNVISSESGPVAGDVVPWLKANPSFMVACSSNVSSPKKEVTSQKKEPDSTPPTPAATVEKKEPDEAAKATVRINVRKTLKNILMDRCRKADELEMREEDVQKIAVKIEEELHTCFKENSFKYRAKYRSLMFNIKDPRNQGLFRKILKGNIPPDRLVRMTSEELASMELAKWREQENQHSLDMIKRVQLEQQKTGSLFLKKTHKGEVEIEDDLTSIIEEDIPKVVAKEEVIEDLDDIEKEEAKDTTHLHRSHLFDLNCKICTGKVVPPPVDESLPKKVRVAHSISVDCVSPIEKSTMKSVDENPVKENPVKVVDERSPLSSTDDSADQEPTSTVIIESLDMYNEESKLQISVWKGFIFMQDIAKFVTSAYGVSGQTDQLHIDLPDTIQVCGRIIPDQVWDYLSKIKQSGNKELIIVRFQAANEEEAVTYDSFYTYLSSRGRCGVVSSFSKKIKDFYILPLAATSRVPMVLLPLNGPGLPSPRPHLLLGVIVRHKHKQSSVTVTPKQPVVSKEEIVDTDEGSFTPPHATRSYTPPLSTLPADQSMEQESEEMYSPISKIRDKISAVTIVEKDDDKPYDPEQGILNLASSQQEKSAPKKDTNPPVGDNLVKHQQILDALTRQVEESDRQLKQLISHPETVTVAESPNASSLDIRSVTEKGMSSFLDLPQNLQEILNSVKLKSHESEKGSHERGDVDMRIKSLFGKRFTELESGKISSLKASSDSNPKDPAVCDELSNSQAATPPPPNDEEIDRPKVPCPSDPRIKLRTSFQDVLFKSNDNEDNVSSDRVTRDPRTRARKKTVNTESDPVYNSRGATSSVSNEDRFCAWNIGKEPAPSGIESSEMSSENNANANIVATSSSVPAYATDTVQDSSQHVYPQTFTAFPPRLPVGFSVSTPPPNITQFPPPPIVPTAFPPPLPMQLPSKSNQSDPPEQQWNSSQASIKESKEREWKGGASHWDETSRHKEKDQHEGDSRYYSSERSVEYRSTRLYKRESSSREWDRPQRFTRGHWNKHSRGKRFENQRRGRKAPFGRNQRK